METPLNTPQQNLFEREDCAAIWKRRTAPVIAGRLLLFSPFARCLV